MDSDLNILLSALRKAINNDPNLFNRAKTDSMYSDFRKEVDALLEEMCKEKIAIAEKEFHNLEYSAKKMAKWFDSEFCSISLNAYIQVCKNIADSLDKLKTQNYLELVEIYKSCKETNNLLMSFKQTIIKDLDYSEKSLKQIPENIKTLINQKNEANKEYSENNKKYSENESKFFQSIGFWILSIFGPDYIMSYLYYPSGISRDIPWFVGSPLAFMYILLIFGRILGIILILNYYPEMKKDSELKKSNMRNLETYMKNFEINMKNLENETKQLKKRIAIAKLSL